MTDETKQFIKDLIDNESDYSFICIEKDGVLFNREMRVEPQLMVSTVRTEDSFTMELWDNGVMIDSDGGEGCFTLEDLHDFTLNLIHPYPYKDTFHDEYEGVPV
jgi:hypothetical protein